MPSNTAFGRFAYTGQIELTGLDLYFYKARIYDPALGRFLQTDPTGEEIVFLPDATDEFKHQTMKAIV